MMVINETLLVLHAAMCFAFYKNVSQKQILGYALISMMGLIFGLSFLYLIVKKLIWVVKLIIRIIKKC